MEPIDMVIDDGGVEHLSADPLHFARNYQLEALEKAIKQNTIVFLETGSGKTLIAIMLLRSYAYLIRKAKPFIAVFLVPTVVLVEQQSEAVMMHTDLKVGKYWGDMGVDYWDTATWKQEVEKYEVLVMTPAILLSALRHGFLKLETIQVLIFDECHNARGRHPYACIMTEFYHLYLESNSSHLPRIFGMTASPIKAKGSSSASDCWKQIHELENLMNSKVYTCVSESVLAEYIPFSTPKLKFYKHRDIPHTVFEGVANKLEILRKEYECSLGKSSLSETMAESTMKRLDKLFSTLLFCLSELGVWLAFKAAESLGSVKTDILSLGRLDARGETIVKNFCSDASKIFAGWIPSVPEWCIGYDTEADINAGYLTSKVMCLYDSLLDYRDQKDLRCIIFVERIVTAIVLQALLSELLPKLSGWRTAYMAGNNSRMQSQSRNEQNHIVDEFRKGTLNIIVATSILEEGLDVQSCNVVIRFDPSATICSFIQSRGRARMQSSDFLIMLKSGDTCTLARVQNYLAGGDTMRQESLRHVCVPCAPLNSELHKEACYKVHTTGAFVNLSSSVQVLYFYCSRLPCDGYFKSYPRSVVDKQSETCTLHLPRSCPIQTISVEGNIQTLKQLACLEACKQLHQIGALTDYLVPDIVQEEAEVQELCCQAYVEEQVRYIPPELVGYPRNDSETLYYCYLIELQPEFNYEIMPHDIVLAARTKLECDEETLNFDLDVDRGSLIIRMKYAGTIQLPSEQVLLCKKFQVMVFRVLLDRNLSRLPELLTGLHQNNERVAFDYLLLPSTGSRENPLIDWKYVRSVLFPCKDISNKHLNCCSTRSHRRYLHTKNGLVCCCALENCLVFTPHNGCLYCISGILDDRNSNSLLELRNGEFLTYEAYYRKQHGVNLCFVGESLLRGNHIFTVQNYLHRCRNQKAKEPSNASVQLPPELCSVIMSPISISTFYSFSYAPSIMHRIESSLIAANLKRMHVDHCTQNDVIPTIKFLEAITTKNCQEKFHLESLETLGDSFLKYTASQQLFMTYQNQHEGILTIKREKLVSNASLCKLGCDHNISEEGLSIPYSGVGHCTDPFAINSVAMFPPAPDRPADMIWNGADDQVIICLDSLRHGSPLPNNVIEDINPYQYKPSNLPGGLWYLLRSTEKKETAFGFWKEKEAACEIFTNSAISGWRTTLEFVEFQDAQEQRTQWVMQKYMITEKGLSCTKKEKESRAICRVFLSSGRSSNSEMHPNSREAAIVCRNHINSVESVVPSADGTSKQGFTKVSNGVDSKQLLSEANRIFDPLIRDISDLHYIFDGDFLEFDDLVDPQSRSTSSDNTTRSSFTMDEYFDSDALLQELEDKKNEGSQAKDSNSRFSVTASIKPLELVM